MELQPCHAVPHEGQKGGSELHWDGENGTKLHIWMDPVIPLVVLQRAVQVIHCAEYAVPVAHIHWNAVPGRGDLAVLYDTLEAHGIPVHPDRVAAMRGWDDMQAPPSRAVIPSPPTSIIMEPPPPVAAASSDGSTQPPHPGIWKVESLEELMRFSDQDHLFTHLWVVVRRCHFPLDRLTTHSHTHAALGMDLCERLSRLSPEPLIRAYHWHGVTVPLLLWYREQEARVVSLIQEYLHIMYPHIPAVRVWHFCLLPEGAAVNLIACRFREAHIWPSWHDLWRLVLPPAERPSVPLERLEVDAGRLTRDPERRHMFTEYDDGVCVMWFGLEAFFYVQGPPSLDATDVTLPRTHRELPSWVPDLLAEESGQADEKIRKNLDAYLQLFADTSVTDAIRLLRRVNWPGLPLHWQPARLRGLPWRVTRHECRQAQERLVRNVVSNSEDRPATQALLARLTGLSS